MISEGENDYVFIKLFCKFQIDNLKMFNPFYSISSYCYIQLLFSLCF